MDLGTVLASAWSAGISLYGVTALLGIAGRAGWVDVAPLLEHPGVIAGALVLFVVELVVDKVAFVDSAWDAAHTVIRPLGASALSVLAPDQDLSGPALALAGGGLALSSHAAKASVRSLVNTSPEPASNVVVSALEDGLVAALMALAIAYPAVALAATAVLTVASVVVTVLAVLAGRRLWRAARRRFGTRRGPPSLDPPAPRA
jgi:hypothetical protein